MNKYMNKYRIPSARLQHWDYGSNASYFITICTNNRKHYFGEIVNGEMVLNEMGEIVNYEWIKTFELRPDMNLKMGEFVVMPNHFHAIIIIGDNQYNTINDGVGRRDAMHCVSTHDSNPVNNPNNNANNINPTHDSNPARNPNNETNNTNNPPKPKNKFGPQSKNLASIIRGFKSAVTVYARKNGNPNFKWQTRFHDHIIRSDESFNYISDYITHNPIRWVDDKFYEQ